MEFIFYKLPFYLTMWQSKEQESFVKSAVYIKTPCENSGFSSIHFEYKNKN